MGRPKGSKNKPKEAEIVEPVAAPEPKDEFEGEADETNEPVTSGISKITTEDAPKPGAGQRLYETPSGGLYVGPEGVPFIYVKEKGQTIQARPKREGGQRA